jgi:hypothetical protein
LQNVGSLGINETPVDIKPLAAVAQPIAYGEGAGVDGTIAFLVAFRQKPELVIPELGKPLWLFAINILDIQRGRHLGEALAHPLIAITVKAHIMPPPLMRHLMRSDHREIAIGLAHPQIVPRGFIQQVTHRKIYEHRP